MADRPIEADEPLGAENEAQWDRLRSQIELAEGFWLGFVFSPSARSAGVLRKRAERALRVEGKGLQLIMPAAPSELRGVLLRLVEDEELTQAGCVWVEAVRSDSPGAKEQPWTEAWDELFLRMNVRRDVLRRRLLGGLVFVAPPETKPRVREAAPDLWATRSLVIDLKAVRSPILAELQTFPRLEPNGSPAPDPEFALAEVARRGALGSPKSQALALMQAAQGLLVEGRAREAREAALKAWGLLEREGGLDEATALAILAAAEEKDKDLAAATDHIERALVIARRVDANSVPVDWYHMAGTLLVLLDDVDGAEDMFTEAENIARAQFAKTNSARALLDLVPTLCLFSELKRIAGDLHGALDMSEEATMLARRFIAAHRNADIGPKILILTLRVLAHIHRALGNEAAALAAEGEAAALDPTPEPPPSP